MLWRKVHTPHNVPLCNDLPIEQLLPNFRRCIVSQSMTAYPSLQDSHVFILACIRTDVMIHTHHLVLLLAFVEEMSTAPSHFFEWFLPLELSWGWWQKRQRQMLWLQLVTHLDLGNFFQTSKSQELQRELSRPAFLFKFIICRLSQTLFPFVLWHDTLWLWFEWGSRWVLWWLPTGWRFFIGKPSPPAGFSCEPPDTFRLCLLVLRSLLPCGWVN